MLGEGPLSPVGAGGRACAHGGHSRMLTGVPDGLVKKIGKMMKLLCKQAQGGPKMLGWGLAHPRVG